MLIREFFNKVFVVYGNVIFIFYFCVVVIKYNKGSFYIFDIYCRGMNGLCDLDGKCIVLIWSFF